MAVKQTIAIIGATGIQGTAIAKALATGSYRLVLMSEYPDELQNLEKDIVTSVAGIELETLICPQEACWEADIIIFAVSCTDELAIAPKIKQYATGKTVISTAGPGTAGELQKLLPNSKVINVCNRNAATGFPDIAQDEKQVLVNISGNDGEALETVAILVKNAGLHPVITKTIF